jgi:alginate O-acetyltransferase complex protein AlgI
LPNNFDFPYISSSFSEFWRRWHISLSTWLRDYLYIPLGGNRKGELRTYLNLFLVMFLGGLWHGAAWTYAVWGSIHGICLMLERLLVKDKIKKESRSFFGMIYVFFTITILWLLFKLSDFTYFLLYIKCIFTNFNINYKIGGDELSIVLYATPVIAYHTIYLFRQSNDYFNHLLKKYGFIGYGLMLFSILVNSGVSGDFIHFQF